MDMFQLWLSSVTTPVRYSQLMESLLVLDTAHPKAMQDLVETVTSKVNSLDNDTLLFNLQQGILDGFGYALQQFEVILIQNITFENLVAISNLLDTLSRLEHYEGSHEILQILDSDETIEEQFLQCCSVFYKVDEKIMELIEYWHPGILAKLRYVHTEKLQQQQALDAVVEVRVPVPERIKSDESLTLARSYVEQGGVVGLPIDRYVTMFSDELHPDEPADLQARKWFQLGLLATLSLEHIPQQAKVYFDGIYPNLAQLSNVYRQLNNLCKGSV